MEKINYRKLYAERYSITIPEGYDVHHIDLNHENNEIGNLLLLPHDLHMKLHKCIQSGIRAIASEALSFRFVNMPTHCPLTAEILSEYTEVYTQVFYWSAAKDFEELKVTGHNGWMPYNYSQFRHE